MMRIKDENFKKTKFQDLYATIAIFVSKRNTMKIDYDRVFNSFSLLEQKIGEIPSFSLISRIPEKHKEAMYEYQYTRILKIITDLYKLQSRKIIGKKRVERERKFEKKAEIFKDLKDEDEIWKEFMKILPSAFVEFNKFLNEDFFQMNDEELLSYYVRHWEMIYNVFVEPIWNNLNQKNLLPQIETKLYGREAKVEQVRDFILKNKELESLSFLFRFLNTKLRNSIVHLDYYIDQKERDIVYFYRSENERKEERITIDDFEDKNLFFTSITIIIYAIISSRTEMSEEFQKGIDKELKKQKKE